MELFLLNGPARENDRGRQLLAGPERGESGTQRPQQRFFVLHGLKFRLFAICNMDSFLQFSISLLQVEITCSSIFPKDLDQGLRKLKAMTIDIMISYNGADSLSASRKLD